MVNLLHGQHLKIWQHIGHVVVACCGLRCYDLKHYLGILKVLFRWHLSHCSLPQQIKVYAMSAPLLAHAHGASRLVSTSISTFSCTFVTSVDLPRKLISIESQESPENLVDVSRFIQLGETPSESFKAPTCRVSYSPCALVFLPSTARGR